MSAIIKITCLPLLRLASRKTLANTKRRRNPHVLSIVSGPEFESHYRLAQSRDPEDDLSTVWIIEPHTLTNETYTVKRQLERENHPLTVHLDRLAK